MLLTSELGNLLETGELGNGIFNLMNLFLKFGAWYRASYSYSNITHTTTIQKSPPAFCVLSQEVYRPARLANGMISKKACFKVSSTTSC